MIWLRLAFTWAREALASLTPEQQFVLAIVALNLLVTVAYQLGCRRGRRHRFRDLESRLTASRKECANYLAVIQSRAGGLRSVRRER